jgi:hypothetical protein
MAAGADDAELLIPQAGDDERWTPATVSTVGAMTPGEA